MLSQPGLEASGRAPVVLTVSLKDPVATEGQRLQAESRGVATRRFGSHGRGETGSTRFTAETGVGP